jgi:single stranded DNA-binding protein
MINQVTLVGRLTKNPDLKVTTEGTYVLNVILAVNRQYRNTHGDVDTDFVQCTLWRKAAENTAQYCQKGSVVGITGRIQTRNYENQDGKKVYVTEVVAESISFLSSKQADTGRRQEVPARDRNGGQAVSVQNHVQPPPPRPEYSQGLPSERVVQQEGYIPQDPWGSSHPDPGMPREVPGQERHFSSGQNTVPETSPVQGGFAGHAGSPHSNTPPPTRFSFEKVEAVIPPAKEEVPFG